MTRAKKRPESVEEPTRIEFKTFRNVLSGNRLDNLQQKEPDTFNGMVMVNRYRVTVELIEEEPAVVFERIRKLWRECDNYHEYTPLQHAARKLGFELEDGELGVDRKR